jgi:hypothetical protein
MTFAGPGADSEFQSGGRPAYAFRSVVASLLRDLLHDLVADVSLGIPTVWSAPCLLRLAVFCRHRGTLDVRFANPKPSVIVAPRLAAVMRR